VIEQPGPAPGSDAVSQSLGLVPVPDPIEGVLHPQAGDLGLVEGAGQHFVAVAPDLDLETEPRLQLVVAEAELVVDEIQVELAA
jgi:hypothetical protein